MAYKFQFGQAILSGALDQEGDIQVKDQAGATQIKLDDNGIISASGNFQLKGDLVMSEVTRINAAGAGSFVGVAAGGAITTATDIDGTGDLTMGTITMSGFTVDADGDTQLKSLRVDDDSGIGCDSDSDLIQLSNQLIATSNDSLLRVQDRLSAPAGKFIYAGDAVTSTGAELNLVDGSSAGTVLASKAVIYDANGQINSNGLTGSLKFSLDVEANGGLGMTPFQNSANVADLKISGAFMQAAAVAVGTDELMMLDADGSVKRESFADYATAIAGDGLAASSGVLAVGVDDSSIELNSDALRVKASGIATSMIADNAVTLDKMADLTRGSLILGDASGNPSALAKGTAAQFLQSDGTDPSYVSISGDATIAAGGALTISADAVEPSMINIFDDSLAATDTHILIADGNDYSSFALSGDVTMTNAGVVTIAANAVEDSMVNDNVATGLAGAGLAASSGVMALDLNELASAAVNVAADSIAIVDADDNTSKKESIADLVAGMAGAGLSAASGQLSVQGNSVAVAVDGTAVSEGYNFATGSDGGTVLLPASPSVGDVVTLKNSSGGVLVLARGDAGHDIDGQSAVVLESPFAAVTCVYMVANKWKIV